MVPLVYIYINHGNCDEEKKRVPHYQPLQDYELYAHTRASEVHMNLGVTFECFVNLIDLSCGTL